MVLDEADKLNLLAQLLFLVLLFKITVVEFIGHFFFIIAYDLHLVFICEEDSFLIELKLSFEAYKSPLRERGENRRNLQGNMI